MGLLQEAIHRRKRILHQPQHAGRHHIYVLCDSMRHGLALRHHARLPLVEPQD